MTELQILSTIFCSVGLFLILISLIIYIFFVGVKKRKCTETTIGIIVDYVWGSDSNLYPVIEYSVNGEVYRRKKNVSVQGGKSKRYPVGSEISVLYDPDKPKRCLFGGTKVQTFLAFVPAIIGFILLSIGVSVIIF